MEIKFRLIYLLTMYYIYFFTDYLYIFIREKVKFCFKNIHYFYIIYYVILK